MSAYSVYESHVVRTLDGPHIGRLYVNYGANDI